MHDLTDFEKGQIVGAHMAGALITKTAEILGFRQLPYQGPRQNSKNTARLPTI